MTTVMSTSPIVEPNEHRAPLHDEDQPAACDDSAESFVVSGPLPPLDPDLLDYALPARGYGLCE